MVPLVMNIQRFSIHDGDGIRTTIFFKGCPLSCAWCHNPEGCSFKRELMFYEERCVGCGACVPQCPQKAIQISDGKAVTDREVCTGCGACTASCVCSARETAGEEIPARELARRAMRDFHFYENSGGGVTLSGGEVMAQNPGYLMELLKIFQQNGISVDIDTCGDVPYERLKAVLPYTDTFLYDMKAFSSEVHKKYTGRPNGRILENLKRLTADGAKINIRIPVIPGVNDKTEMERMAAFAEKFLKPVRINLLPYHRVGTDKRLRLGQRTGEDFTPPSGQEMEELAALWKKHGFSNVEIGG